MTLYKDPVDLLHILEIKPFTVQDLTTVQVALNENHSAKQLLKALPIKYHTKYNLVITKQWLGE